MDIFPTAANMVGVLGFEPRTSSLSGTRSNQLSYTPSSPKSCLPFGHGPQAPASRDCYFSGARLGIDNLSGCHSRSPAFRAASPYSCLRVRIFVWSHPSLSDAIKKWWSRRDSNPQHPACKAGALAIELRPLLSATGLRPPLRGTATFRGPRLGIGNLSGCHSRSPAFRAASPYSCLRV